MVLVTILAVVFGVSILSLVGGLFLLYKEKWAKFISHYLISFAAGSLIGLAFLELLPGAIENLQAFNTVALYLIAGIVVFYLTEKSLLWYHHHYAAEHLWHHYEHGHKEKTHPVGYLITIGDGLHNFLDGAIISASFLIDFKLGFITSFTVLAHELPQEIGDFAVMLHGGFSRTKVVLFNLISQLMAVLGALLGFFYLPLVENLAGILLAFAAGGFIYIAGSDLIPETHAEKDWNKSLLQIILLVGGVLVIWYLGIAFPE